MKQLLKYVSNDDHWIIEQMPQDTARLYKNIDFIYRNSIQFERDDIGTLIGLLTKLDQQLNENPS